MAGRRVRRLWKGVQRAFGVLFFNPAVRIIFAAVLIAVLVLGLLAEGDSKITRGWLPAGFKEIYSPIAAALAAQPLVAGIGTAMTRRKQDQLLRSGLGSALSELVDSVRQIGRINTHGGWRPEDARGLERRVIETTQRLLTSAGVEDVRVCFYEVATTDATQTTSAGLPVVNDLKYVYHFPGQRPEPVYRRCSQVEGLFNALDTRQPTHELDRPAYDPERHRWRSASRVAVEHEDNVWGVLTADSPQRSALDTGCDAILGFGAAFIAVARLSEDQEGAPATNALQRLLSPEQPQSDL